MILMGAGGRGEVMCQCWLRVGKKDSVCFRFDMYFRDGSHLRFRRIYSFVIWSFSVCRSDRLRKSKLLMCIVDNDVAVMESPSSGQWKCPSFATYME